MTNSRGEMFAEFHTGGVRAESIVDDVKELLSEAGMNASEINCCLVNIGPGSYTGIRTGISFAQGFCAGIQPSISPMYFSSINLLRCAGPIDGNEFLFKVVVVQTSKNSYVGQYAPGPGIMGEEIWSEEECRRELTRLAGFFNRTIMIEKQVAEYLDLTHNTFTVPSVLQLMLDESHLTISSFDPCKYLSHEF